MVKMSAIAIEVDHDELQSIIERFYKAKRALFCWGTMGIGKSDKVRDAGKAIAKSMGLIFTEDLRHINSMKHFLVIDVRLSQCDPSDLRGIPYRNEAGDTTIWLPPSTFPRQGFGIILFDEMNLAPPLVQASAYQFILDRKLGEYRMPDGYGVLAAGNRLEDRANFINMNGSLPIPDYFWNHVSSFELVLSDRMLKCVRDGSTTS